MFSQRIQNRRIARRRFMVATAALLSVPAGVFAFLNRPVPRYDISGAVLDSESGQPLAGAQVTAGEQTVQTDDQGRFTLASMVQDIPVEVSREGYRAGSAVTGPAEASELQVALQPYVLTGKALDATTQTPLANARVVIGEHTLTTGADGAFKLSAIVPGTGIAVSAPGYKPAQLTFTPDTAAEARLEPKSVALSVVNQWTGSPVEGAAVAFAGADQKTGADGVVTLLRVEPAQEVKVQAPGFAPATLKTDDQAAARVELRPDTVSGSVKSNDGKPLAKATITAGELTATTDEAGAFKLAGLPADAVLMVRKEGFTAAKVEVNRRVSVEVSLEPRPVRSTYLSFYGVGSDELLGNTLTLMEQTELNAITIDVKGDRGWIAYKSAVPMVSQIGAQQEITIPNPDKFVKEMKDRGIYLIARIVTFKDNPLAQARPDLAIQDRNTGQPWVDGEDLRWIDASQEEAWEYNVALAKEAANFGFDEVQFDYIRFPTDPGAGTSLEAMKLARDNTMENRVSAVTGFLKKASTALEPTGTVVSMDCFGYVCWREDDMGIGQHLESLGKVVDVISPMIYPNLFWSGIPASDGKTYDDNPAAYPYEIVHETLKIAKGRLEASNARAQLRPWLQYYNDYISGMPYGDREVRLQKKATYDAGISGWLFWDPSNWFKKGGFDPAR